MKIFYVCTAFCREIGLLFWLWHQFVCLVSIILLFRRAYFCKRLYILHMTKTTAASNTTHVFNVHHLCNERQLLHRSPFLRYNARWIYWKAFWHSRISYELKCAHVLYKPNLQNARRCNTFPFDTFGAQKCRKIMQMTTNFICKLYVHWTWIVLINARRPCIHRFRKTRSTNIPISYDQYYFAMFKLHNITTKQSER